MHPIELYEQFLQLTYRVTTTVIDRRKNINIVLSDATKQFHQQQSKQETIHEILHFDTLALGYFPRDLTKQDLNELQNYPYFFESCFVLPVNADLTVSTCEMDEYNNSRNRLLTANPYMFMWMLKYWNDPIYKNLHNEKGDSIYFDDSFTDYDIFLLKQDDPMVLEIIKYFEEGAK